MSEWQPIETAPKDGRPVLLWWRGCTHASIGQFEADEYYDERPPKWRCPEEGWRCEGDECIPVNQRDCTHWMPLPEAPA